MINIKLLLLSFSMLFIPSFALGMQKPKLTPEKQEELNDVLIAAARNGDKQKVRYAISGGAQINEKIDGRYALIEAAKDNRTDVVKILLDNDANANVRDKFGQTPLWVAAIYLPFPIEKLPGGDINPEGNIKIFRMLLPKASSNQIESVLKDSQVDEYLKEYINEELAKKPK